MTIQFLTYRRFEISRTSANDAILALLVGVRIAGWNLGSLPSNDRLRHLPDLFPEVRDAQRMNRTAEDAVGLLKESERYLVYMGIPFVLSIYQTLVVEAVRLLRRDGKDLNSGDPSKISLEGIHSYLTGECGVVLPLNEVALFDLIRQIRNRIIHFAGVPGSNLRPAYVALPSAAKDLWVQLTGGPFEIVETSIPMELEATDLIPALAVTKRLSKAINGQLSLILSRELWATLVLEDYRGIEPARYKDKGRLLRRISGLARHQYGDLGLTEEELENAILTST